MPKSELFLTPDFAGLGDVDGASAFAIQTRVIHTGTEGHGCGGEFLDLFHHEAVSFQPAAQLEGVVDGGSWMADDDVGNDLAS